MLKNLLSLALFLGISSFCHAQMAYAVNLNNVVDDKVKVELQVQLKLNEEANFCFPMTIPGTYAVLDFRRFASDVKAFDAAGNELKVKKDGDNCFSIAKANTLSKIEYWVEDTWDFKKKKNWVFEPAGTNIEDETNFVFTNSGLTGFFPGFEQEPITLTMEIPEGFAAISAMPSTQVANKVTYKAKSYHQLVDCPVMVSEPDSVNFKVGNCDVSIAVYRESGDKGMAQRILTALEPSMEAIEAFVGDLPVDNYAYIIYAPDLREVGAMLNGTSDAGFFKKVKAILPLLGKGFGALEHQNSSLYYMPEFNDSNLVQDMVDVAIHEFMHIITPLNLHSEYIGNFDYIDPKMSEHLWLYEGITEYFAGIIQLKGGLIDDQDYFVELKSKLRSADNYPDDMAFADMSRNVLEKPYKKQYSQVYTRGAIMGLMLDLEIMHLSQGEKTLIDVILELVDEFGMDKPFKEDEIVPALVEKVDPALQLWFDNYVYGTKPLDLQESLAYAGIIYQEEATLLVPVNLVSDNDVKYSRVNLGEYITITKVGKKEKYGLEKGDQVPKNFLKYFKDEDGNYLAEGSTVKVPILRDGNEHVLSLSMELKEQKASHVFEYYEERSPEQQAVYQALMNN